MPSKSGFFARMRAMRLARSSSFTLRLFQPLFFNSPSVRSFMGWGSIPAQDRDDGMGMK